MGVKPETREALKAVSTATLCTALYKRGLRKQVMENGSRVDGPYFDGAPRRGKVGWQVQRVERQAVLTRDGKPHRPRRDRLVAPPRLATPVPRQPREAQHARRDEDRQRRYRRRNFTRSSRKAPAALCKSAACRPASRSSCAATATRTKSGSCGPRRGRCRSGILPLPNAARCRIYYFFPFSARAACAAAKRAMGTRKGEQLT